MKAIKAKAMKAMKAKLKAKKMKAIKAKAMKAMKAMVCKKPAMWLTRYPSGCAKCRNVPGCTPSCWKERT